MQIEAYAKRLTNPFQGLLQIIASPEIRALSFNGKDWEIQFFVETPTPKAINPCDAMPV